MVLPSPALDSYIVNSRVQLVVDDSPRPKLELASLHNIASILLPTENVPSRSTRMPWPPAYLHDYQCN